MTSPGSLNRRELLRWLAVTGGATAAFASCSDPPGGGDDGVDRPDADPNAPDADPACRPTTGDAQGPFFEEGAPMRTMIADQAEPGDRMILALEVLEEGCTTAAAGVLVDIWQADRDGAYHDETENYRLRGQAVTPRNGRLEIQTIKPGNYALDANSWRPAHVHFTFTHPDYVTVTTQLYFEGDPYLPPNDGCTTCGSDDTDRVIALTPDNDGVLHGTWRVVLRRA